MSIATEPPTRDKPFAPFGKQVVQDGKIVAQTQDERLSGLIAELLNAYSIRQQLSANEVAVTLDMRSLGSVADIETFCCQLLNTRATVSHNMASAACSVTAVDWKDTEAVLIRLEEQPP